MIINCKAGLQLKCCAAVGDNCHKDKKCSCRLQDCAPCTGTPHKSILISKAAGQWVMITCYMHMPSVKSLAFMMEADQEMVACHALAVHEPSCLQHTASTHHKPCIGLAKTDYIP